MLIIKNILLLYTTKMLELYHAINILIIIIIISLVMNNNQIANLASKMLN